MSEDDERLVTSHVEASTLAACLREGTIGDDLGAARVVLVELLQRLADRVARLELENRELNVLVEELIRAQGPIHRGTPGPN